MSNKCIFCDSIIDKGTICKNCISIRKKECAIVQEIITIICPKCRKILGYEYNKKGVKIRLGHICDNCLVEKQIKFQHLNVCPKCGREEYFEDFYSSRGYGGGKRQKPTHNICSNCYRGKRKWNAISIENRKNKYKLIKNEKSKVKLEEREKRKILYNKQKTEKQLQIEKIRDEKIRNGTFDFIKSERMKKFNPVKNPEVRKKISETIKRKIKSREIIPPKGINRYNYIDGGNLNNTIRRSLYKKWSYFVLQRDNFKCKHCGNINDLQVHHLRPFNEIVKTVLNRHNITYKAIIKNNEIENFNEIVNEIIDEHKIEDGITLCKYCHEEIDYQYRIYKGVKKCK